MRVTLHLFPNDSPVVVEFHAEAGLLFARVNDGEYVKLTTQQAKRIRNALTKVIRRMA